MKFCLRIVVLVCLALGTKTQDFGFDLEDALKPDPTKAPPAPVDPKKKSPGDSGSFGFDLEDALKPDPVPNPDKPAVYPPKGGGGGGSFDDSDLYNLGGGGDYKPDGGQSEGGRAADAGEAQAGSGKIAGIASAIGVALIGAVTGYFAYQKKKLCFKLQGGADPERGKGHSGTHSDPQVLSDLLRSS